MGNRFTLGPTTHAKLYPNTRFWHITVVVKKSHTRLLCVTMVVMFFLEKPNNHLENHRFFRKLGGLEPTVLWSPFSQIPEDPEYCVDFNFFKYLELAVITQIREPPPHWCEVWTSPRGYYSGVCKPRWSWFRV